jgi:hypothetical protein
MSSEAVPEVGRSKPATPARFFLVVAIALLLLKLLLVSRREMAPETHDAEAYASASMQQLGSVFSADAYHPPGASLVMAMARSLGVPYRIFIEVFLALAAFLFLRPLVASMGLGVIAVALSYALLLFHPNLILEMDRPMSDSVSFLCWLIGAGGIIGIVAAPRERLPLWSLGLVIVSFAFAGITRSGEGTLFFVEMVAVAFLSVLLFRGADGWRGRRAVVVCLCAVLANLAAVQALSAAHYFKSGYWGASAVESREWWRLYSALLSLPVQRTDRYVLTNKATMEMAESFSEDLRDMKPCIQQQEVEYSAEELPNYGVNWVITGCLPGEDSSRQYFKMRKISEDILAGARERGLHTSAPVLGIIPRPAMQWLPDLPSSIVGVARDAVRIPGSTRVAQNSWQAELFDRALLRRTALVATGENPEVFGYQSFIKILYRVVAALFWPLVPIFLVAVAAIAMRSPRVTIRTRLIAFALSLMVIDVLCRVSFYSLVDWILWELPPRYMLGANVLSVIIVSTLLTLWLAPAAARMLRPKLVRFPGFLFGPKVASIPVVPPNL